jgi:long-chain acyl-CoA synthetase
MQLNFIDASSQVASVDLPTPVTPQNTTTHTTTTATTLPALWPELAERYGNSLALLDPHASPPTQYTFAELSTTISTFAKGLSSLGLTSGDHVSLFSENSCRWLITDQATQACGAVDAVRGVSSTVEELSYIMQHSESSALFVQDLETLKKLAPVLTTAPLSSSIRFVVVLWGEEQEGNKVEVPMPAYSFNQVLDRGHKENGNDGAANSSFPAPSSLTGDSLATLVYTSGTTGSPKGVQLTHSNILYQVKQFPAFLNVQPGSKTLSILPPWHIYERTVSYHILSRGSCQVYSTIRHFRDDLGTYPPDHLVCVPLVLDTLRSRVMATLKKEKSIIRKTLALTLLSVAIAYTRAQRIVHGVAVEYAVHAPPPAMVLFKAWVLSIFLKPLNWLARKLVASKIRSALGVKKCVVSGGGSLAPHLDDFFEAVGLPVLNGYGLTETSPVLACRAMNLSSYDTAAMTNNNNSTITNSNANLNGANCRGSVGRPIPETEIKIVNPDNLQELYPDGTQGLILVRGPGVMKGYYNNESATAAAFAAGDGWFDTGDLGWIVPSDSKMAGCLVLTGRAKDTIVLSSGENVEPQPIEDAICASPYIKFAALIGQGHRSLGVLLVPDTDALAELAKNTSSTSTKNNSTSPINGANSTTDNSTSNTTPSLSTTEVDKIMREAITAACAKRVRWEHVTAFKVLEKPFSVEDGTLTKTMKPRRAVISEVYKEEIAALEAKLR